MPLPDSFQFSQSSLQDYVDCPRRFELRYILHQKWPALQTQPVIEFEHHMEQGSGFTVWCSSIFWEFHWNILTVRQKMLSFSAGGIII